MSQIATEALLDAWSNLQQLAPISVIHTEDQYDQAVEHLHNLVDTIGEDETHPLSDLLDTLSVLVENYETVHYPAPTVTGVDVLRYLMTEHELTPENFPELGGATVVAELLAGQRDLSIEDIRALSRRFGLSPATFF
jgi:HTH-type transcriptional regulator / antitoxin HigA